jgi:DNA-binding NarL/FixJ family response regulator
MGKLPTSILIIEGHPLMHDALRTAIENEPDMMVLQPDAVESNFLIIECAHDQLFLSARPDIILLSMENNGANELGILKAIRKSLPETPILVLTSNEVPGQEQAALKNGAHSAITKAASRLELIQALRALRPNAVESQINKAN